MGMATNKHANAFQGLPDSVRAAHDYYVTPQPAIRLMLWELLLVEPHALDGDILDPSAGGDAETEMSYPAVLTRDFGVSPARITTVDIREDSRAERIGDFLTMDFSQTFDLIISNPPFKLALEFIKRAYALTAPGGLIVMLFRSTLYQADSRFKTWHSNRPSYIFSHAARLSFTGDGKTDGLGHMHVVFVPERKPDFAKFKVVF